MTLGLTKHLELRRLNKGEKPHNANNNHRHKAVEYELEDEDEKEQIIENTLFRMTSTNAEEDKTL